MKFPFDKNIILVRVSLGWYILFKSLSSNLAVLYNRFLLNMLLLFMVFPLPMCLTWIKHAACLYDLVHYVVKFVSVTMSMSFSTCVYIHTCLTTSTLCLGGLVLQFSKTFDCVCWHYIHTYIVSSVGSIYTTLVEVVQTCVVTYTETVCRYPHMHYVGKLSATCTSLLTDWWLFIQ